MDPMNPIRMPRPDVVTVESTPRPTARPARVAFGDVLAAGASGLAQGAQLAVSALPGSAVTAAAVRGGGTSAPMSVMSAPVSSSSLAPEGPGAAGGAVSALGGASVVPSAGGVSVGGMTLGGTSSTGTGTGTDGTGSIEASLQQSANLNIYYLQLQEQEDAQNRAFTAQSNILKTEHDGCKNAIGNIHS
jgi:hypothetical protein